MTPELKTACEVVFQEHKLSSQIKWNRDTFRGRISIGLSEMAKETLVQKHIIFLPNKAKKIITLLNPAVAGASSFEEAKEMIEKNPDLSSIKTVNQPAPVPKPKNGFTIPRAEFSPQLLPMNGNTEAHTAEIKWYLRPFFYYVLWPICAAIAGAMIAWLMSFAYSTVFSNLK